jgi:hypothetical protein
LPVARRLYDELERYAAREMPVLWLVVWDKIDQDYGYLIQTPDRQGTFHCPEMPTASLPTLEAARFGLL